MKLCKKCGKMNNKKEIKANVQELSKVCVCQKLIRKIQPRKVYVVGTATEELKVGDICVCHIDPTNGDITISKVKLKQTHDKKKTRVSSNKNKTNRTDSR